MSTGRDCGGALYEPFGAGHMSEPWVAHRRLRTECPVHHAANYGIYVLSRYDDIVAAARDYRRFSSATPSTGQANLAEEAWAENFGVPLPYPAKSNLATVDPPLHTLNRKVMTAYFSPRHIKSLEPYVRQVAQDLASRFLSAGHVEFVSQYATWLPMTVITRELGFAPGEVGMLKSWSDGIANGLSTNLSLDAQREMVRSMRLITENVLARAAQRRDAPGPDLISHLVHAVRDDGTSLDDRDIASLAQVALVGGNETTTNLLGGMLLLLVRNPDALDAVRSDPGLAPAVVEEALRYISPTQALYRVTTAAAEVDGTTIPEGERVHLLWGSANHDETAFPDPERFDIRRVNTRPHLAFGIGPHFCVGSALARLEARVTLEVLIPALRHLRLSDQAPPDWKRHFHLRGLEALHLDFDPVSDYRPEADRSA